MAACELDDIIVDERVLAKISKGMYGLPQAGRLAYDQLVLNLGRNGYHPCKRTHGLWRSVTRPRSGSECNPEVVTRQVQQHYSRP